MKKYFIYLIFYSVGGFVLERIINLVFYGNWLDNSVLIGPYQPLYGSGLLLTIIFYDKVILKMKKTKDLYKEVILIIAAIIFTGMVEAITGYGFEYLFDLKLWDYGEFFPCSLPYVCIYTTSLFGVLSYLVVKYLHPLLKTYLDRVNKYLYYALIGIFVIDIVLTLINLIG